MEQQVLEAITDAFHPQNMTPELTETGGRVFGFVRVEGSNVFNELDDIRRQQRLWASLLKIMGPDATAVGPIVLEPRRHG